MVNGVIGKKLRRQELVKGYDGAANLNTFFIKLQIHTLHRTRWCLLAHNLKAFLNLGVGLANLNPCKFVQVKIGTKKISKLIRKVRAGF